MIYTMLGVTNPGKSRGIAWSVAPRHVGPAGGTSYMLFRRAVVPARCKGVF